MRKSESGKRDKRDPQHGIIVYASSWASLKISKLHIEAFSPPKKDGQLFKTLNFFVFVSLGNGQELRCFDTVRNPISEFEGYFKDNWCVRNGLVGEAYSTKFSPWLAAGCLSPRLIYQVRRNTFCLSVSQIRDPGSGAFLTHGSRIRCPFDPWIRDPVPFWPLDPGSGAFLTPVSGIRCFFDPWIWDPVRFWPPDPGSGIGKKSWSGSESWIRDE